VWLVDCVNDRHRTSVGHDWKLHTIAVPCRKSGQLSIITRLSLTWCCIQSPCLNSGRRK
jgi:hypothetical protein